MIEEVIEKLLGQKEFLVDNYRYILSVAAVLAYVMVTDDKSRGFAKATLVIKKFPLALLSANSLALMSLKKFTSAIRANEKHH